MKVLVFGGTGWVGHHIVLELAGAGYDVPIVSRGQKKSFVDPVSSIPAITADKHSEEDVKNIFQTRYDAVIDTVPTLNSIALIAKYAGGLKRYLHCSSTGGYAPLPFIPCNETAPYRAFCGQGWAQKAAVDAEVSRLFHADGFPYTVLRPCYITGPGRYPLDNQGGRREDYITDILEGRTLDVPDNGLALLQPVHVKDLAACFRLALETPAAVNQIYNICLSHAVTLKRYHEITAAALGTEAKLNYVPLEEMLLKYQASAGGIGMRFLATHMCFSIDKARRDLGYQPHCSPEEAIEENARWAAEQLTGRRF